MQIRRLVVIFGTLTVLTLLAGCGPSTTIGTNSLPIAVTVVVTRSSVTNGPTNTVRTGPVTLHTNAAVYRTGDTIFIKLSNQSTRTIYFPDHLTNCTVILLQRQPIQAVSRSLQPVNLCRLEIVTRMHALGAGQSLVVRLIAPLRGWPPGGYIATLSYRTSTSAARVRMTISTGFRVGPLVREGL